MLLMWEISLWDSDIQTGADIGSVCMHQLQRDGSGWFKRTNTFYGKFPCACGNPGMVSACLRALEPNP